jgi:hypothetical protein
MILAHTIEAVVSGRITRVHCNTCGGQHAYRARAPGAASGRRTREARADGARPTTKPARDYASLLRGRDPSTARAYSGAERFKDGELIRHPTFGLGLVTALKDVNKIEVLFADGSKTLIHRR